MAAQQPARTSPELRAGSTQPALTSELHHVRGHYHRHKIDILSLGCGDHDMKMTDGQIKRSGLFHWKTIIESAMHLQSQNALERAAS